MQAVGILLSGGPKSIYGLHRATLFYPKAEIQAVTIFYGQPNWKEINSATQIVQHYRNKGFNIRSHIIDLSGATYIIRDGGYISEEALYSNKPSLVNVFINIAELILLQINDAFVSAARTIYLGAAGYAVRDTNLSILQFLTSNDFKAFPVNNIPMHLTWSCLKSGKEQCGTCTGCLELKTILEQVVIK